MNHPPPLSQPTPHYPQYQRPPQTSGAAIASLITGILSFVTCCGCFTGIPAVICGHVALSNIKRDPQNLTGTGLAIAGLIMGYLAIVVSIAYFAFIAANPEFQKGFMEEFEKEMNREMGIELNEALPVEEAEFLLITPEGHDPATPIPVAIWLHGYGATPFGLSVDEGRYQKIANNRGIAFAAISAPVLYDEEDLGDGAAMRSYEWHETVLEDAAHIEAVIAANSDTILPAAGKILLFGFSQGAKVASDVAAADPGTYAGAFLISPGGQNDPSLLDTALPGSDEQAFSIVVGDGEHPGNIEMAEEYRDGLTALGADVWYRATVGQSEHDSPGDVFQLMNDWLDRALPASE